MFTRFRSAWGLALLLALLASFPAFAKGGFSFIEITGPKLKEAVRLTDSALAADFFAFADFSQDKAEAPADPGKGYEITRYYVDGQREIAFDHLHYFPETGLVYYDGILNGSSEYDGKWYTAQPDLKSIFKAALAAASGLAPSQSDDPLAQTRPNRLITAPGFVLPITALAGLAAILAWAFWRRRTAAH